MKASEKKLAVWRAERAVIQAVFKWRESKGTFVTPEECVLYSELEQLENLAIDWIFNGDPQETVGPTNE